MASTAIALRRLVSQRIVPRARCEQPADVVRRLGALQAQDYGQSLWAIEQRQIVRTWLMRGTIHFAPPEDVRWLLALVVPRLEAAEARRCAQLGLTEAHFERCADLLSAELSGDRRLTRPDVMRLFEQEGIETSGQRGYHILVRLAKRALICLGPLEGRQQTFVLLDEWAPRASSLELEREQALALLASRFASGRGPVTDQDFARWAGIPLSDARQGLREAAGIAVRSFGGVEHWLDAARADGAAPAAGRHRTYLLAGFDEYFLGYKDRDAVIDPAQAGKVAPGANGIFRPLLVIGGQIAGTWERSLRRRELTITLHPFTAAGRDLVEAAQPEAARYRAFLGVDAAADPVVLSGSPEA